jgi:hypothetical protein
VRVCLLTARWLCLWCGGQLVTEWRTCGVIRQMPASLSSCIAQPSIEQTYRETCSAHHHLLSHLPLLSTVRSFHFRLPLSTSTFEMSAEWTFEAQYGYFSHDSDPETWKFRATTRPGLGLVERSFVTDADLLTAEGQLRTNVTQWQRFMRQIQHLNKQDPDNKQYKMFYVVRHGQGFHNVEEEVGRDEWNVS